MCLLPCDVCVWFFIPVANLFPSTVGIDFVIASCCTFRFVDFVPIVSVLCQFVFLSGVSAMPPAARMSSDEKRIARDMHERGFIPSHIAEQESLQNTINPIHPD